MAVAQAQSTDQILAAPKVDDIYAGRVDFVSDMTFGDDIQKAYGLMRVIEVSSTKIVLVTEDAAWEEADGALQDLKGDFSDITWDFEEEIEIERSKLAALKKEGVFVEARRLKAAQIKDDLN